MILVVVATQVMATEVAIKPATFSEFSRSGKQRCDGAATSTQVCWTDSTGKTVRYGCRVGERHVYSEDCGMHNTECNVARCQGNWEWKGDKSGICYDSGTELYEFQCPGAATTAPVTQMLSKPSAKSCFNLGWPVESGDLNVCGGSKVDNNKCAKSSKWSDASAMCHAIGARLCTLEELAANEAQGSGCKLDCEMVWTDKSCTNNGHMAAPGSSGCRGSPQPFCSTESANVRCCADVLTRSGTSGSSVTVYPKGYYPAYSHDFRASDGVCGQKAPLDVYTCWSDEATGLSQRMACSDRDLSIWFQACGSDSDCQPSSCSGDWMRSDDIVGRCYLAPQGNLYQYSCPDRVPADSARLWAPPIPYATTPLYLPYQRMLN